VTDHCRFAVHEYSGHHLFAEHGSSPYFALRVLIDQLDGAVSDVPVEIDGEEWLVTLFNQPSGLEPSRTDDVESLYEYRLHADGEGRRKFRALLQPRLDWEPDRQPKSVPNDCPEGVNVRSDQSSNVHPVEFVELLPKFLNALADELGLDWNSRYFGGPLHDYSSITQLEVYARLQRDMASKVVGGSGVMRRLFDLVADRKGSSVTYHADNDAPNMDIVGYNHRLLFDAADASLLFDDVSRPGKRRGGQLKHYHPEYVRGEESQDDPLYHPKVGWLFKTSLNDGNAVAFAEVADLLRELEENLANVLAWSEVPIDPTTPPFVSDDHFVPQASGRDVELIDDPTPTIERDQESVLVRTMTRLEDSDLDVLDRLISDGGRADVDDLADESGWSVRTVYRVLDRLDEIIDSQNGSVSFLSRKVQQDVREVVRRVETTVEASARVVEDLLGLEQRDVERKGRAFQNWLTEYGAEIVDDGSGAGRMTIDVGASLALAKSRPEPHAPEVANFARHCWSKTGRDPAEILDAVLEFELPTGESVRRSVRKLLRSFDASSQIRRERDSDSRSLSELDEFAMQHIYGISADETPH